jgi:hypothetical protein
VFSYQMFASRTASTTILWQAFCRRAPPYSLGLQPGVPRFLYNSS